VHDNWADDLQVISQGVEGLFGESLESRWTFEGEQFELEPSHDDSFCGQIDDKIKHRRLRRTNSQDLDTPQLRLSGSDRTRFVSPASKGRDAIRCWVDGRFGWYLFTFNTRFTHVEFSLAIATTGNAKSCS
jgi:hypothetical protein